MSFAPAVFEIPKGMVKTFTTIVEVRTGKKIQYESAGAPRYAPRR